MWSERAKDTMMRCAQAVGMQEVVVVLEPEAASLCVQNQQGAQVKPGDVVLVLDCGGGTVDLVTHDVQADGTVKELAAGSGDCCGGSYVDAAFLELMERKYRAIYTDWVTSKPKDVLKLRKYWLAAKIIFGSGGKTKRALITLPTSLQAALEKAGKVDEDDEDLELSEAEMKSIFDPIVDRILKLTEEQYQASARRPTKLLLVGGFAGSPYLQQRVKAAFGGRVEAVVVPPTPGAAVVKGAVIYGLNPRVVASRIARRTYGTDVAVPFAPSSHNEKHKYYDKEEEDFWAKQVFSVYVQAGIHVSYDQVVTKSFRVGSSDQAGMIVRFFSCPHPNPVHVDEPGVREEGVVRVQVPGTGRQRSVKVVMKFGRAQIQASATNEDGERMETTLTFAGTGSSQAAAPRACRIRRDERERSTDVSSTTCELCAQTHPEPITYHSMVTLDSVPSQCSTDWWL